MPKLERGFLTGSNFEVYKNLDGYFETLTSDVLLFR
jgi:hypothetical protein